MNSVMCRMEESSRLNLKVEASKLVIEDSIRKVPPRALRERYQQLDDLALIIDCQNGVPEAFDELVKRTRTCVIGRLHRFAPSSSDVSDLSQEVFIRVWRNIARLKNPRAFKCWLLQIITHILTDEFRKRAHLRLVSIDEPIVINGNLEVNESQVFRDSHPSPEELIDQRQLRQTIWHGIVQLKDPFKAALVLRDVEDRSYHEVAQIMGTGLGTVKSRIARARKQLAETLGPGVRDVA